MRKKKKKRFINCVSEGFFLCVQEWYRIQRDVYPLRSCWLGTSSAASSGDAINRYSCIVVLTENRRWEKKKREANSKPHKKEEDNKG